ncbi:hypothetical protein [Roseiarcus sp.]|jgi:hypothetical protein|uniref:hypothetical protein n=1 Tax=Roseiarcus sp. TaxID=1969460 RepID=UPI003D14F1B8
MFRTLMTSRRFAPLFWRQFFSAFNDSRASVVTLDAIPPLGSGKINYVALAKALRQSGDAG